MLNRYSKLGFSGNDEPSFVFPTAIAVNDTSSTFGTGGNLASKRGIENLNFYIGDEAFAKAKSKSLFKPIDGMGKLKLG